MTETELVQMIFTTGLVAFISYTLGVRFGYMKWWRDQK